MVQIVKSIDDMLGVWIKDIDVYSFWVPKEFDFDGTIVPKCKSLSWQFINAHADLMYLGRF